jgi:hypothetical protein
MEIDFDPFALLKPDKKESKLDLEKLSQVFQDIYQELFNSDKNLEKLSDLTEQEISVLSVLQTFEEIYSFRSLKTWNATFLRMRVSKDRVGRAEIIHFGSKIQEIFKYDIMSTMELGGMPIMRDDSLANDIPNLKQKRRRFGIF